MCERDIRVGLKRLPKGLWSTDNSLLSLKDLGFSLLGLVLACLIFSCFFFSTLLEWGYSFMLLHIETL